MTTIKVPFFKKRRVEPSLGHMPLLNQISGAEVYAPFPWNAHDEIQNRRQNYLFSYNKIFFPPNNGICPKWKKILDKALLSNVDRRRIYNRNRIFLFFLWGLCNLWIRIMWLYCAKSKVNLMSQSLRKTLVKTGVCYKITIWICFCV